MIPAPRNLLSHLGSIINMIEIVERTIAGVSITAIWERVYKVIGVRARETTKTMTENLSIVFLYFRFKIFVSKAINGNPYVSEISMLATIPANKIEASG